MGHIAQAVECLESRRLLSGSVMGGLDNLAGGSADPANYMPGLSDQDGPANTVQDTHEYIIWFRTSKLDPGPVDRLQQLRDAGVDVIALQELGSNNVVAIEVGPDWHAGLFMDIMDAEHMVRVAMTPVGTTAKPYDPANLPAAPEGFDIPIEDIVVFEMPPPPGPAQTPPSAAVPAVGYPITARGPLVEQWPVMLTGWLVEPVATEQPREVFLRDEVRTRVFGNSKITISDGFDQSDDDLLHSGGGSILS